jgi:PIN domain nuclease of toxin-antitoxin system
MNPILLDTHAAIWSAEGLLKADAAAVVKAASLRRELLLSPISAWEIGMLIRRGRLAVSFKPEEYVRVLFGQSGIVVANVSPAIAVAAGMLPEKLVADPADRILIATANAYGARLLTRDKRIHDYAKTAAELRCIAC